MKGAARFIQAANPQQPESPNAVTDEIPNTGPDEAGGPGHSGRDAPAGGPGPLRGDIWMTLHTRKAQELVRGRPGKGGKERRIPVVTGEQRRVLDEARRLASGGSLIPSAKNYRKHLRVYESQVARADLSRMHGLRHAYAHWRYEMLAGWPPPAAGGPGHDELTPWQKEKDKEVRMVIIRELGHERP